MSEREQILERQREESTLSGGELAEADSRSSPSAKIVDEAIRLEGAEEFLITHK